MAAQRTATSPAEFRGALERAFEKVTGKPASAATVEILGAHVSHETGRGASMFNYNFGGIKGHSPAGLTARCRTHEYIDGQKKHVVDGFRAYRSLDDGAVDYIAFMHKRYAAALDEASQGDVDGFAAALKARSYYTAPLDGYTKALRGLMNDNVGALGSVGGHELAHRIAAEPMMIDTLPTIAIARRIDRVTAQAANIAAPQTEEIDT